MKLCVLFQSYQWIQTGITSQKPSIQVKFTDNFLPCVTLKLTEDLEKTIGHLFYATSSFVYHFIIINQFKLELQSVNANLGQNLWFFVLCDLEIWQMTLKNNRAPLLTCMKLCVLYHRHQSIQTGVTVWKYQIGVKISHNPMPHQVLGIIPVC